MLQGCSGSCNRSLSKQNIWIFCWGTPLRVEVNAAIVKEVLSILRGGEGRHQMQRPLTHPAVGPVIPIILEILLNGINIVKCHVTCLMILCLPPSPPGGTGPRGPGCSQPRRRGRPAPYSTDKGNLQTIIILSSGQKRWRHLQIGSKKGDVTFRLGPKKVMSPSDWVKTRSERSIKFAFI